MVTAAMSRVSEALHSFTNHLLSSYYVSGIVLCAEGAQ